MIIKKFVGKTETEAVENARKELGEGIVIMNVRQIKAKGIFSAFRAKQTEVTVALEEDPVKQVKRIVAQSDTGRNVVALQSVAPAMQTAAPAGQNDIEKKLDSLQTLLETQIKHSESRAKAEKEVIADAVENQSSGKAAKPEKEEKVSGDSEQDKFVRLLYNTMIDNEVDEKYANSILEDVDKSRKPNMPYDYILANIYQKMILKFGRAEGVKPAEKGPAIVFFIGPTGVGKTTTIAKLASLFAVEKKKKTVLLTADTYRIAAAEQLRTYAGIMEVPFRVVYTEDELYGAVADFKDYDYIFVDTAGHSHRNEKQMDKTDEMLRTLKKMADIQVFLVVSATTKYRDLKKIADSYKEVSDYQLIFTKLDETGSLGNLLNLKLYVNTPIAYITCGQNVPEDIEEFNPQKVVKQILGGKS